jgi:amino acid adenylation domain-containing protein
MSLSAPAPSVDQDAIALLQAHYRMQLGGFLSRVEESEDTILATSELCSAPMWNHVALLGNEFPERLKSEDALKYVYVIDGNTTLLADSFEKFERESWMVFEGPLPEPQTSTLKITRVENGPQADEFARIFYSAFKVKEPGYKKALVQQIASGDSSPKVSHYIGYAGGTAVCAATWIADAGEHGLYNMATAPEHRKKGYAAALLTSLIRDHLASNQGRIFLQVEKGGGAEKLYRRLGFREVFTRSGFRRKATVAGTGSSDRARTTVLRETLPFPPALAKQIKHAFPGRNARTVLAAAWACLLTRYQGEEICEFAIVTGQEQTPVRLTVPDIEAASSWLPQVEARWNSLREGASPNPETAIIFDQSSRLEQSETAFTLALHISPALDHFEIHSHDAKFAKDALRRLASHFLTLLQSMTAQPHTAVSSLEMLTPAERRQILVEWNNPPAIDTRGLTIREFFEAQVEKSPDAPAILASSGNGDCAWTYRQLNRRANKLAHYLKGFGIQPGGSFVGVCLSRSPEYIVTILAVWKAGGVVVPLDPGYPAERLSFVLGDTGAQVIITESKLASRFDAQEMTVISLDTDWNRVAAGSEKNPSVWYGGDEIAYVIYTSGSTGTPKGVLISHAAFAEHCVDVQRYYGLNSHDRVLQFSSFNFDASLEQIVPPLLVGASLFVRGDDVWSSREFAGLLGTSGLTVADLPTAYWHQFSRELAADPSLLRHHTLRLVIVGGEAMGLESLRFWNQTTLSEVRLINAYGPTETTITATAFEPLGAKLDDSISGKAPIGRPRGRRSIYILDKFGNLVPVGVPGEIHIGGSCLAVGYLHRPELTRERFVSNPFSDEPEARIYKTGDIGRFLENGNIEFLGRLDDQVKIRGYRIELGEIENALMAHTAVSSAVVLALEQNGSDKRLVAYCTLQGSGATVRELKAYLKSKLPDYMIPSSVVLVEKMPLTSGGKVDRKALPAPDSGAEESDRPFKGPSEPLELQLQLVFERVLNRVPIAVDANFFEFGGDSLQALELIVEIERTIGKSLPLGTLYQSPTVESLARAIHQEGESEWSCLVPLQTRGKNPPLYLVHTTPGDVLGYGNLIYHLGLDQPCYGFQSLGLKEPGTGHAGIEQMAEYYVNLLREFQPTGPYLLGGWCYGGMIAVEMARLLREQGQEVPLLALLETVAMPPGFGHFRYYAHRFGCTMKMGPVRWARYVRHKIKYMRDSKLADRMRFKEVSVQGGGSAVVQDARLAHLEEVYNRNLEALNKYRTRPFDGRVTLFNASEQDPALIPDPEYGWVGLAKEIEIHPVPGNHDTMLAEPHVRVLAAKLKDCMQKASKTL